MFDIRDIPSPRRNEDILPWAERITQRANRRITAGGRLRVMETPDELLLTVPDDEPAPVAWAIAYADWQQGTYASGNHAKAMGDYANLASADYVMVQDCNDQGEIIDVAQVPWKLWLPGTPGTDPAVFAGMLVAYTVDGYGNAVAAAHYSDEALYSVKFRYLIETEPIEPGWHICDGTTPDGSKIGQLPNTRGLYTRATDYAEPDNLWSDGTTTTPQPAPEDYVGAADNTGGDNGEASWGNGGRAGVSSSRKPRAVDVGADNTVQNLLDVKTWNGPVSDGDPFPDNNVVVAPPTYVLAQIIRYR